VTSCEPKRSSRTAFPASCGIASSGVVEEELMPIYEYRCKECGKVFSKLQSMGATAEGITCPACGSPEVERMVSSFASASSGSSVGAGASSSSCSGFT